MSRNYQALLKRARTELKDPPVPQSPDEMVLWLRERANHIENDSSQDQFQAELRLAADMMEGLLENSTV